MAIKVPLVLNAGQIEQLQSADSLSTSLPKSMFEKGWGELLMPADGLTAIHMGGLWEEDVDGNFQPKASPDISVDTFWEVDGSDNLMPRAA